MGNGSENLIVGIPIRTNCVELHTAGGGRK